MAEAWRYEHDGVELIGEGSISSSGGRGVRLRQSAPKAPRTIAMDGMEE